jgi:predicted nucleotidyltransferase
VPLTSLTAVLRRVAEALEELGVPFAVSGGVAQNYWGIVRTTLDLDLLITLPALRIPVLVERLSREGARVELAEALRTLREEHVLRARMEGVPLELFVPYLPFHASVLARAVRIEIEGRSYPVSTAEDLVVLKALFHREKDWSDIAGIVARQGAKLDREYVRGWLRSLVPEADDRLRRLEEVLARAERPT